MTISKKKTASKKKEANTFKLEELHKHEELRLNPDLLNVLLDEGKEYTVEQVKTKIKDFMDKEV